MLLAQGFCFLIASLMHHASNCTDLERFRRDYRKGFLAEVLSSLSLCTGLGDCIDSPVNYGLNPQYFNFTCIDFFSLINLWGSQKSHSTSPCLSSQSWKGEGNLLSHGSVVKVTCSGWRAKSAMFHPSGCQLGYFWLWGCCLCDLEPVISAVTHQTKALNLGVYS